MPAPGVPAIARPGGSPAHRSARPAQSRSTSNSTPRTTSSRMSAPASMAPTDRHRLPTPGIPDHHQRAAALTRRAASNSAMRAHCTPQPMSIEAPRSASGGDPAVTRPWRTIGPVSTAEDRAHTPPAPHNSPPHATPPRNPPASTTSQPRRRHSSRPSAYPASADRRHRTTHPVPRPAPHEHHRGPTSHAPPRRDRLQKGPNKPADQESPPEWVSGPIS